MKRFFVFLIIIVVAVAFGFMTYFFLKDNEKLTLEQAFYEKNTDEPWSIEAEFYKHKETTTVTVTSSDTNVVEIGEFTITETEESKSILSIPCTPKAGGFTTITIETSNENIEKFIIDVSVGDGSKDYPYFVDSVSTLGLIGTGEKYSLESSYKLTSDINLAETNEGEWTPIGGDTGFSGTFDGNYRTIYNLKITNPMVNAGFFTKLNSTAVVQNLTICGVNLSGTFTNVGTIAAINHGKVKLCSVISNLGVGTINNTIAGTTQSATGVIVGRNEKQSADSPAATVNQVLTNVAAQGNYYLGGIAGVNVGSYIYNCYSTGTLTKTTDVGAVGGLIGLNDLYENKASYLKDCYSISKIEAGTGLKGALIGQNNSTSTGDKTNVIFGCYYNTDVNGSVTGIGNEDDPTTEEDYFIIGKTTNDLKIQDTFISHKSNKDANVLISWDFDYAWNIETDSLPTLNLAGAEGASGFDTININGMNVNTSVGLQNLAKNPNDNFLINNDIDMQGAEWTPIPVYNGILAGVIGDYDDDEEENLRYPIIKNLTINIGNNGIYALFEQLGANAQVMNLTFENVTITGTGSHFATVAGINKGTISNLTIGSIAGFATITATTHTSEDNTYAGGVAAYNEGIIKDCEVNATITATTRRENINFTGGIAGFNTSSGSINQCFMHYGQVSILEDFIGYVGGIVGSTAGVVNYSYTDGCEISSTSVYSAGGGYKAGHFSGGVAGYVRDGGRVEACYSKANVSGYCTGGVAGLAYGSINQCFSVGKLTGHRVGGLVAIHLGSSNITNSYANCTLEGYKNASGYDEGKYSYGSLKAGLACISEGGNITQCYSACSFTGQGKNFFDTSTIVPDNKTAGNVRKNVIDASLGHNAEYAGHQGFWGGLASSPVLSWMWDYDQYFRAVSTDEMMGNTGGGFKIYTNYDFGDSTWSFSSGSYPELKVFITHPFFTGAAA